MDDYKEIIKLRNSLAIKTIFKVVVISIAIIAITWFIVDGVYNDKIANNVSKADISTYMFFVLHKTMIAGIFCSLVVMIVSFFVIRDMSKKMLDVTIAVDKIIKDPLNEVKIDRNLLLLESKLNNIRLDLIESKNAAKDAENKKNELIMYMAHDLKTPLTSVIGYLTLLNDEENISYELKKKYTNIALDKALRVEDLTNQFFEVTKYNLKDMPINKTELDLSMLMDQLVDECYPMLLERNLRCNIQKPEHIYYFADGDKIARCFGNILKNSINYSYENTDINVIMCNNRDNISIVFKNKGNKIPEYKLQKLFEKFYRADESRHSGTGGTGLGLAIAKEIVELHNGNIYVKNDTEWIEFYIELPVFGDTSKKQLEV